MKLIPQRCVLMVLVLLLTQTIFAQAPNITYGSVNSLTVSVPFSASPLNTGGAVPATTYGQVTTLAGSVFGTSGYTNATGTSSRFNQPQAAVGDASGNLYIADALNNVIRKITAAGVVTTFAGSSTGASGFTDGTGTAALFNTPMGLAIDASGNLFVSDKSNNAIRKITPAAVVTTFYSTTGTFGPTGLSFDASGNLLVALQDGNHIVKISPSGALTSVAGQTNSGYANGTAAASLFFSPKDVKTDASGNLFVADYLNNAIREISTSGMVSTFAGSTVSGNTGAYVNDIGTAARFYFPTGIAFTSGGVMYAVERNNNDVRRIMPNAAVTQIAGSPTQAVGNSDGTGTAALFASPGNIFIDGSGTGYITEVGGNRVRKIILTGYSISGTLPAGLTFDPTTGTISGTPTGTITSQSYTVTAFNTSGYSSTTITLAPPVTAPVITYAGITNNLASGVPFTISPTNSGGAVPATIYGQVTTLAGSVFSSQGYVNGTGTSARFNVPYATVTDASGNVYVADNGNNVIRKVTSAGVVTTFAGSPTGIAGSTDGTGTSALFNGPDGIAIDGSGNLYVSDYVNNRIRKITPSAVVTTFYVNTATSFGPAGLCFDHAGNLVVSAQDANKIESISPSGVMTIIAGNSYGYTNGTGANAAFELPEDVQVDGAGNIFVADYLNNAIRKITPAGVVTTFAGSAVFGNAGDFADGVGTTARFNNPTGVALGSGNVLYVADLYNNAIRKITPDGTVSEVAGNAWQASGATDGTGSGASFYQPVDLSIDGTGTGYIADAGNGSIRKIVLTGYSLSGTLPAGLTFDPATGTISGTPTGTITPQTYSITAYNTGGYYTATVTLSPLAQVPSISYAGSGNLIVGVPVTISPANSGGSVPLTAYGQVTTFVGSTSATAGYVNSTGTAAQFNFPQAIIGDASGNLYIADAGNNVIRKVSPSGVVTTFAGSTTGAPGLTDGTGTASLFNFPDGLAFDASGNLFVSDYVNNAIRKITPAGAVTTFYHTIFTFGPAGICFDSSGNLIVAAQDLSQILKITPAGVVSTIAGNYSGYVNGTGTAALFNEPTDVKIDGSGNMYVVDYQNNAIRKITPAGVVTTVAGSTVDGNNPGYAGGIGTAAVFNNPSGITIGAGGVLYITDLYNNDIRSIMPDGTVSLVAGSGSQVPGNQDGTGTTAGFNLPVYQYIDGTGMGYIAEFGGHRIRKIILTGYFLNGALPAGLTFDPATGTISGTPTAISAATTFTITAYNTSGIATATVTITVNPGLPSNPANDYDKNWVYTRSYDENGVEIGASKVFFDNNGKATQSQSKSETTGQVLATQTIYDLQGRAVVSTLAAPTNNSAFAYKNNFITNNGSNYSYLNFDGDPTSTSNAYAKLNNPDPIDNTQAGTLGWYYSNNNTFEPYVAATSYPYSRGDFYHDGTGAVKRSAGIGEQLKMGTGHEITSNSFQVQNELNNYLAIRNQFFGSVVGSSPTGMAGQALQTVSKDQNGLTAVSITDLTGKTLMTGRADPNGWLAITNTITATANRQDFEVALTISPTAVFSINSNQIVNVYYNGSTTPQYTGSGNGYFYYNYVGAGSYVITSSYPFSYSITDPLNNVNDAAVAFNESGTSSQYFRLVNPSAVTITGSNYELYDMTSEQDMTSNYQTNNTLQPGYYKIVATAPAANGPAASNVVTVTYTNKYADISYNYYNQLGQLIANIAPNGVQQLIQNGFSGYTASSQLPFITSYEYDLQGRVTAVTTPDAAANSANLHGGKSNFIYRKDGKIRFSQNPYQANSANAGTGNVEKFSYTNYDNLGRPFESGEYAVSAITFANLASNTTLLDATDATANITGGIKLSQINTYYDLPDPNLNLTGYVQDAGFLKGAVSHTSNANSTTWYNYDDHGRVTWTVKLINGLAGYKTVDYTYNDQGNVTKVDYQKGTPLERFIHYYAYDADGRLINVQTSRDDIAKVQQAAYYYYLHGPLKRTELGDHLQGIDYVYTPQGWLKSINSPAGDPTKDPNQDGVANSFAKDAFGLQLEYFSGDYSRTTNSNIGSITSTQQQDYFNGNVNGISWQSNKPPSVVSTYGTGIQNPAMYTYSYDPKYQLAGSTWGTPNFTGNTFTGSTNNMFQEKNIAYDFNGNITSLQRTNNSGILSDDFSNGYSYQLGTNKLNSVSDATKHTPYATYGYDEIGRMKSETKSGTPDSYYLSYDVMGKVTGIYSDVAMTQVKVSYTYDEDGNRVKTVNPNGTTYYVYDAGGKVLAIYTGTTPAITEVPIYGSSRLGTYTESNTNYVYELRDNVGSIRVVINRTKNSNGQGDVITFNDYFPYGSIAQSGGATYRYDYQGAYAEKDPYTNWNNFELRMYDGRIGRWLSLDPAGQFASPYEGMGNSPVNGFDPTGGEIWHFDKDGNLVADNGDNAQTLTQQFNSISLDEALRITQDLSNWNNGDLTKAGLGSNWGGNSINGNTMFQSGNFVLRIDGLNINTNAQSDQATIRAYNPVGSFGFFYHMNNDFGFVGKVAYSMMDAPHVYVSRLLGNNEYGVHIDGSAASHEDLTNSGASLATLALPGIGEFAGVAQGGTAAIRTGLSATEAFEKTAGKLEEAHGYYEVSPEIKKLFGGEEKK